MFKTFKSFKTWAGLFDGLNDLNGLNVLNRVALRLLILPIASFLLCFDPPGFELFADFEVAALHR